MAITFIRSVNPAWLALGANDTTSCDRHAPDCKPPISWANPSSLRVYELTSGERVTVCRRDCAVALDKA